MSSYGSQTQSAWSTAGGDATRRGAFDAAASVSSHPARRLPAFGAVHAPVVFEGKGRAFVADMSGNVQSFSPAGRPLWRRKLDAGISAAPVVDADGKMLFAGTYTGWVYGLDASDGAVVWRTGIPTKSDARILSDLLLPARRGALVLSSWGGRFVALDPRTGKELHSWDAGISPGSAAAADADGNVYCLRAVAKTGVQLVRISGAGQESVLYQQPETDGPANRSLVAAAPVLDPNRRVLYCIFNAGRGGALAAWSVDGGRVLWKRTFQAALGTTPAVTPNGGAVIVTDMSGFVHSLAPDDGAISWRYATGGDYILAAPVCERGGTAFVADSVGVLHEIKPTGVGTPLFELPRSAQARPSFSPEAHLHIPCTDHQVYIFAVRTR
jgi:outer membrane protein assembly factor BamB